MQRELPDVKPALAACLLAMCLAPAALASAPAQPKTGGIYGLVGPDAAANSTLKFAEAGVAAAQTMLLAVPEAPSAALLIIGLAAVGVAARRRAR